MRKFMKTKLNRRTLLDVLTLYGRARYSVKQYEHLAFLLSAFEGQHNLPSNSSIRSSIWPFMIKNLCASSSLHHILTRANREVKKRQSSSNPQLEPFWMYLRFLCSTVCSQIQPYVKISRRSMQTEMCCLALLALFKLSLIHI